MWAHQPSPGSSQQLYWVLKVMVGIAKSTTTPDHKTTLYTIGFTKGFHSPHRKPPGTRPNPTADQPHEQCSHPPPPCLRAKWSKRELLRVSKPDRKTVVPNRRAKFGIYWNPNLTHHPRKSLSNAPPNPKTWQEQRSHTAHMTRPQTRQAPTKQ